MADKEKKVSSTVAFWVGQIDTYEQQFQAWKKRSKEITKRYRDTRNDGAKTKSRFNILWSNIQTLQPAIYANPPKPNIDRRYQDDDDLGRYAALVLERSVSYYVNNDMFDKVMKQVTLDRLLPGRGVAWVRYCPVFTERNEEELQITDDTVPDDYNESLVSEDTVADYVHWEDFGHTWGRTWQEVRGVWRRVYMSRSAMVKRFGDVGKTLSLDAVIKGKDGETISDAGKKACIYEIWDKVKRKAIWVHKDHEDVLDEKDDPLGLKDFFPCPEPLYATLVNDDLIPTPDYVIYQDQAIELDNLTGRITSITKSLKVAGVYDASAEGLDRLLSESVENKLIPVQQWAVMGEKGLKGVVSFFPIEEIVRTLISLYEAREKVKQDLYEITGISDIVRGATQANETATAQQLKGQFATLRLDNNQKDVARFSRDLVRIMTEIIASHFSLETIKKVSGIRLLTAQEKQQIGAAQQQYQIVAQQAEQTGQQPPPPPEIPEEVMELMDMPTWEEVESLIRDDTARSFRIDIETDSTIKTDQEAEKQSRIEFLTAVGGFMQQAVMAPPSMQPLLMKMMLFGVRGFKVSREIETEFENAISKMTKEVENPNPQPSPEQMEQEAKAKAEEQRTAMEGQKLQLEGQRMQVDTQAKAKEFEIKEKELALKDKELNIKADLEVKKLAHNREKSIFDAKGRLSEVDAANDADLMDGQPTLSDSLAQLGEIMTQGLLQIAQMQAVGNQAVIEAITRPKEVIRNEQNQIVGVK